MNQRGKLLYYYKSACNPKTFENLNIIVLKSLKIQLYIDTFSLGIDLET